jgi:hypothetical protein
MTHLTLSPSSFVLLTRARGQRPFLADSGVLGPVLGPFRSFGAGGPKPKTAARNNNALLRTRCVFGCRFSFLASTFNFSALFAAFAPKMQSLGCGWYDQFSAASVDTDPLGKQCADLCKIVSNTTVPFGPYKGTLKGCEGY